MNALVLDRALAASSGARAQSDYPEQAGARSSSTSAAGSANNSTSRILADKLSQIWSQPVVTLNQPGAGGGISARVASQSPNDGYTLYLPSTSTFLALPGGRASRRTCRSNCRATSPRSASSCSSRSSSAPRTSPASRSLSQLIQIAKEKPSEDHLCGNRARPAHASDHGAAAGARRHQAAAHALCRRSGAGDERRDERPGAACARRLCRACRPRSRAT